MHLHHTSSPPSNSSPTTLRKLTSPAFLSLPSEVPQIPSGDSTWTERAVIVAEPDADAADCFNTERAACCDAPSSGWRLPATMSTSTPATPAGKASGRRPSVCCSAGIRYAEGFSVNVANCQTTGESYRCGRELSDLVGTASSSSKPPATASAFCQTCPVGRRVVQPTTPGLGQAPTRNTPPGWPRCSGSSPRRVGRPLRRQDHLPVLPNPGAAADRQQPMVAPPDRHHERRLSLPLPRLRSGRLGAGRRGRPARAR
jgi:hypothetical protein